MNARLAGFCKVPITRVSSCISADRLIRGKPRVSGRKQVSRVTDRLGHLGIFTFAPGPENAFWIQSAGSIARIPRFAVSNGVRGKSTALASNALLFEKSIQLSGFPIFP
jgi:hypothetical protein